MKRGIAGLSVGLLLAIAGYSIYVAVVAEANRGGKHYSPAIFWTAIGLFWVIAAASVWGARRVYRRFVGVCDPGHQLPLGLVDMR